ncbi:hypothetical protein NI17_008910 [Thermobifida halotolerans]|uniref:Uncharacterized protein n=1 Tax=Thermobifida halotolerans TaxID=483545 RepID=A0AA97LZI3_9ACTN|nr:hypothetical protein [Thermobifida halotolerans]UOE21237.1 hypothetical protein NI17_008910 [Thermobifida halotolerans]
MRALDAVAGTTGADGSIVVPPGGPFGRMTLGPSFFLLAAYHLRDVLKLRGPRG